MPIVVNTNVNSLIAQRHLTKNNSSLQRVMEQLSSGYRINRAGDDAAGLSIAQNLTTQIKGNTQALANIQDAMNLVATAEAGLNSTTEHLQRIRVLCVQAATEIYNSAQKQAIGNEIQERLNEINRLTKASSFNGILLLDGSNDSLTIQIGCGSDKFTNTIDVGPVFTDIHTTALGIDTEDFKTASKLNGDYFRGYMDKLDTALEQINSDLSKIGAYTNTMESAADNLSVMVEASTSSRSRIMDVDVAQASSDMLKYQILQSASASVLQQANSIPQIALQLLGG